MRLLPAVLGDAVAVLVFVGIGRSAHHHLVAPAGMASTSWPFLVGLACGWVVVAALRASGRHLGALAVGLVVWPVTVGVGMALRAVAGQGVAAAFVAVALCFLGLFLVGWRLVALLVHARLGPARRRAAP